MIPIENMILDESQIDFNYSFTIEDELIDRFIKAKKALSSAYCSIQQIDGETGPTIEFTLGELEGHANKIVFTETPAAHIPEQKPTMLQFNADYLKSIFDPVHLTWRIVFIASPSILDDNFYWQFPSKLK